MDPGIKNPVTGRMPVFLHAPGELSLDAVCLELGLPTGAPRRQKWKVPMLVALGVVLLMAVLLCKFYTAQSEQCNRGRALA